MTDVAFDGPELETRNLTFVYLLFFYQHTWIDDPEKHITETFPVEGYCRFQFE